MGTIGRPPGGDAYPADRDDLDSYRRAHAALEQLRVPVLVRSDNPHERLFVAALDGTGNSLYDDKPENWSAVARIFWQIETTQPDNIAAGYVEGTFTQNGVLRTPERSGMAVSPTPSMSGWRPPTTTCVCKPRDGLTKIQRHGFALRPLDSAGARRRQRRCYA